MIKEGSMDAWDYRGYSWLHTRMLQISKKRAIECIDKALELSKENPEEFYSIKRTRLWILAGEIGEGQRCIEEQLQAVKDEPENVEELACLGWAYYWAKQYEECYQAAKESIAKFPEEADFYNLAGDVCRELKKYDEAFGENAELSPQNIIDKNNFQLRTPDVIVKVDPSKSDVVETRVIDGTKYILIRADNDVEVNGVNIKIKK